MLSLLYKCSSIFIIFEFLDISENSPLNISEAFWTNSSAASCEVNSLSGQKQKVCVEDLEDLSTQDVYGEAFEDTKTFDENDAVWRKDEDGDLPLHIAVAQEV